jgi:hypothetical protein
MHATLLMPGEEASATLYNPMDCLSPVLYDAAGHRTPLSEWCPSESTAASPSTKENVRGDRTPRRALCALSTPPLSTHGGLPTLGGLGALLLLLSKRIAGRPEPRPASNYSGFGAPATTRYRPNAIEAPAQIDRSQCDEHLYTARNHRRPPARACAISTSAQSRPSPCLPQPVTSMRTFRAARQRTRGHRGVRGCRGASAHRTRGFRAVVESDAM